MGSIKQAGRAISRKKRQRRHRQSVGIIAGIILLLVVVVFASGMSLKARNERYEAQVTELKNQIADEKERSQEIDDLQNYVNTDEYVEDVAREKLGLAFPNEILFKTEEN